MIGSYDNTVQLWNKGGECLAKLSGHVGAVKAVSWVSIESNDNDTVHKFVSASHDQSIVIWEWHMKKSKLVKTEKCIGHTESVECIDLNSDKSKVLTKLLFQIWI